MVIVLTSEVVTHRIIASIIDRGSASRIANKSSRVACLLSTRTVNRFREQIRPAILNLMAPISKTIRMVTRTRSKID